MIRKMLMPIFESILDICFVCGLIAVVLISIFSMLTTGFISGLVILLSGGISLVMCFGGIYLLLDIREELRRR